MYDTSDIRKGLKIMLDGSPYTVVEFQFVKPGKGAAFTRTKMKNLLTGAVLERNLRSGERLEPADVETKTMQYLYGDADSFIFMDTTTYDQVHIPKSTVGDQSAFMPENINVEILFFNGRAVDVSTPGRLVLLGQTTLPGQPFEMYLRGSSLVAMSKLSDQPLGFDTKPREFERLLDTTTDSRPLGLADPGA